MKRLAILSVSALVLLTAPATASAASCLREWGGASRLAGGELAVDLSGLLVDERARVVRIDVTVSRAGRVVRYERARWRVAPVLFGGDATYRVPRAWQSVGVRVRMRTSCGGFDQHFDVTRSPA